MKLKSQIVPSTMEQTNKEHHLGIKGNFLSMERTKGIEDFDDLSLSAFYVNVLLVQPFTRHEQMHSYAVHSLCIKIVRIQCKN